MDNNKNEELFFKVFNNISLKNQIFSFIHREKVCSTFSQIISIELILNNLNFELLKYKLQSKSHVKVTFSGIKLLFELYDQNIHFKETFQLLWNQYNETIKSLNPLSIIIFIKDDYKSKSTSNKLSDLELFKYIYNTYYNNSNNSNNSKDTNKIIINQSYQLYDLLDYTLKSKKFNKYIANFIYDQIKNNNESNNNNNNNIIDEEFIEPFLNSRNKEILESIYSNKEIPLFLAHNIDNILEDQEEGDSIKEKIEFIKGILKVDNLNKLIKKNCNYSGFIIKEMKYIDIKNNDKEILEISNSLLLNSQYDYKININLGGQFDKTIHLDNFEYLKLFILNRAQNNKFINFRHFKKLLILNQHKIKTIQELINVIENFKNKDGTTTTTTTTTPLNELYYYFDIHLLNYYLKQNNINQVLYLIKSNLNFKQFDENNEITNEMIKSDMAYLLFNYSIVNFSIEIFQLFLDNFYNSSSGNFQIESRDVIYYEKVEFDENKFKSFINFINSNNNVCNQDQQIIREMLEIIIINNSGNELEYVLQSSNIFNGCYYNLLSERPNEMFYYHFNSCESKDLEIDFKKINIYLYCIQFIQQFRGNARIHRKRINVHDKHIGKIIGHILNYQTLGTLNYFYFLLQLHNRVKQLFDLDESIKVFQCIDQDLLKYKYEIFKQNDSYNEISQFHFNKSNLLVNHLFTSIDNKDLNSINKILSVVNNSNCNNLQIDHNNSLNIINQLFLNGSFKNFDYIYLFEIIKKKYQPSNEILFKFIQLIDNKEIKELCINNELITIKYHLSSYLKQEEGQEEEGKKKKKIKGNEEYNKFINYFINGHYQQFIDTFEKYKSNDVQFLDDVFSNLDPNLLYKIKDKVFEISYSLEWFKKLFTFISIYIERYSDLLLILLNCNFEILEYLWSNYLVNDITKKKLILEIFKFQVSSFDLKLFDYHSLMEYILKEKKEFIKSIQFDDKELSIIHRVVFSFGNISIFNEIRSIFNNYQFIIDHDLMRELIFNSFNNSTYACNFIEYLYYNNYLQDLNYILSNKYLSKLTFIDMISNEYYRISKSLFILIHKIIKLQEEQQSL